MSAVETVAPVNLFTFLLPGLTMLLGGGMFGWWARQRLIPTRGTVHRIFQNRTTNFQRRASWHATLSFTDQHGQSHTVNAQDGKTSQALRADEPYRGRLRVGEETDICFEARNPERVYVGGLGFQTVVGTFAGAFLGFFLGLGLSWLLGRLSG